MAVTAYERLRLLWGAVDWQGGSNTPYAAGQTVSGGAAATPGAGNIGVRRAVLVMDRSLYTPADDDMICHFDWLNVTAGSPDDTWTTADYTTMETILQTAIGNFAGLFGSLTRFREIRWYRHGSGVVAPNPAERVYVLPTPIAGSSSSVVHPPQVACSVTFRTAVRRSWGRTYLPISGVTLNAQGRLASSLCDTIAGYVNTMVTSAAAADFRLVVTSIPLKAALNVEKIEVDDVTDVIRRRRWKHTTYRKLLP